MSENAKNDLSKVPAVTLTFWVVKILATTLGETGGDAVSMSMNLGYVIASIIFLGIFAAVVAAQIAAKSFYPFLYWAVIVATTTLGTTLADFADRSLGIGYAGGSSLLFILLMASLGIWYKSVGSVSVETITSPKVAPSGRVRINAAQKSTVRETREKKYAAATNASPAANTRAPPS